MNKDKFKNLINKSIAVIAASIGAILSGTADAQSSDQQEIKDTKIPSENSQAKSFKPQLVLKSNPNSSELLLAMHTSHSSHSSHSSHFSSSTSGHYSHASHSSHYSSSPTYTPSNSVPYTIPSEPSIRSIPSTSFKSETPKHRFINKVPSATTDPSTVGVFKRVLRKGCQGSDVEDVQLMLSLLQFDVIITGYFGDTTEEAVKDFQLKNGLTVDGIVGLKTYQLLKSKS
jgi:hypothetical protein